MSVVAILAAAWAWAILPPLVRGPGRGRGRDDPMDAFARFQARDLHLTPPPARRPLDPARRRAAVLGTLLTADVAAAAAWLLLQHRWLLATAAAGTHLTVAWYGLAVRRRVAARRASPAAASVTLPRHPGLATAA